jgi:integrase
MASSVLDSIKGAALHPIIATALGTGMRRGEILALRWRDVDLDGATTSRVAWRRRRGPAPSVQGAQDGRRNIALPAWLVSELRSHWRRRQEARLAVGMGKGSPDDFVFCTVEGGPRKPNSIIREWSRLVSAKKLPKVSFHALRHTHVSQLISSAMNILTISRRIGHASPAITLSVYGHLIKNSDSQAALLIEAAFGNAVSTE